MTADLAKELVKQGGDYPSFVIPNVEDATMGVWMEYIARVCLPCMVNTFRPGIKVHTNPMLPPQDIKVPVQYVDVPAISVWMCRNDDIISHYVPPEGLLCMYDNHDRCCPEYTPVS